MTARRECDERGNVTHSRRARLQVRGSVSDHHHRLEAVFLFEKADDPSLATALACGLALIKSSVLPCGGQAQVTLRGGGMGGGEWVAFREKQDDVAWGRNSSMTCMGL